MTPMEHGDRAESLIKQLFGKRAEDEPDDYVEERNWIVAEFEQVRAEALEEATKIATNADVGPHTGEWGIGYNSACESIADSIRELATKHIAATQGSAEGSPKG